MAVKQKQPKPAPVVPSTTAPKAATPAPVVPSSTAALPIGSAQGAPIPGVLPVPPVRSIVHPYLAPVARVDPFVRGLTGGELWDVVTGALAAHEVPIHQREEVVAMAKSHHGRARAAQLAAEFAELDEPEDRIEADRGDDDDWGE